MIITVTQSLSGNNGSFRTQYVNSNWLFGTLQSRKKNIKEEMYENEMRHICAATEQVVAFGKGLQLMNTNSRV